MLISGSKVISAAETPGERNQLFTHLPIKGEIFTVNGSVHS